MNALANTRASGALFVVGILIVWEICSRGVPGLSLLLPPFSTVVARLATVTMSGDILTHGAATLFRLFTGYFVGAIVAIPLGLFLGYFRPAYQVAEPLMELLRPVPSIAVLPIAILFMGLGFQMQTAVIGWAVFWPVLIATCDGMRSLDPTLVNTARAYGYRTLGIFRRVALPASLPYAMAGLRVALTIALILAVFIEMITSGSGLGYLIAHYREAIRIPEMYGAIIAVAVLGYCLNLAFLQVERVSIRWHHLSLQAS